MSAVAEALLEAHKNRSSGWMTLTFWGRESKLLLKGGDLVGAQMGFGHQSVLQGLLQSKKLTLTQLDALWARGDAGKADPETLEELGASPAESSSQQVLAQVRRLATVAAKVKFEAGEVSGRDAPVRGVEAVRAAFESVASAEAEPKVYRCVDRAGCDGWVLDDDERALLDELNEFKNPGKLPAGQRVLLELLEREGKVESEPEAEYLARLAEEERQKAIEAAKAAEEKRRADEEAKAAEERRRVEEAERAAAEKRRIAEEARAAEARQREEEEARLAEERRLAEEAERAAREQRIAEEAARREEERQKAEALAAEEARLAEEARVAEEARLAEEKRAAEEAEAARLAEEKRAAEEAEAARLAEEMRVAEEKRQAEEQRLAEEAQQAEEQRRAEESERARLDAAAAAEARLSQERRFAEEMRRAKEARAAEERSARQAEEERLAEERRRAEAEAKAAEEKRKAEEEAHLAEQRRRAEEEERERLAAEEKAREEEEARFREQERLAAERIIREDEERRAEEARLAAERAAEEERREKERVEREAKEKAEAEERLAEQRRRYEEERLAEAAAVRDMTPDGWFSPKAPEPAPSVPTEPVRLKPPTLEGEIITVPEAVEEPPTLEAEVIDAEVEPTPAPPVAAAPVPPKGPVPMEQALPSASEADRLNLAKHRAQADLLKELNEALRRSAAGFGKPAAPAPSAPPVPQPSPPSPRWDPPVPVAPTPIKQPVIYGGPQGGDAESSGDLWSLVKPSAGAAKPPGGVASFEEALKRVDASLEQLVDAPRPSGSEPPVEATVEAVVEPGSSPEEAGMEGDLADPSDPNEAAKARRQRLLRRAMENLGAFPAKKASSSATTDPDLPAVNVADRVDAKANASTPKANNDDLQLKAQVEARWDELQKRRELYAILGVPLGGGKDQVKAAFLTLAKIFHPDRLPPSLPELAPKIQTVFESIREAYETLYDDARRATYMSTLASGTPKKPAAPAPGTDVAELMRQGEVHFKKREYRLAEEQFAKAYAIDKAGTSLAAQAWAIYMDPQRKAEAQNAKQLMQKAVGLDANSDRAHYQLGVIARVEGDMERAERHFRDAVRINPRHLEANQEIRLIEMRKKKGAAPKGGGGFFSR